MKRVFRFCYRRSGLLLPALVVRMLKANSSGITCAACICYEAKTRARVPPSALHCSGYIILSEWEEHGSGSRVGETVWRLVQNSG